MLPIPYYVSLYHFWSRKTQNWGGTAVVEPLNAFVKMAHNSEKKSLFRFFFFFFALFFFSFAIAASAVRSFGSLGPFYSFSFEKNGFRLTFNYDFGFFWSKIFNAIFTSKMGFGVAFILSYLRGKMVYACIWHQITLDHITSELEERIRLMIGSPFWCHLTP